MSFQMLPPLVDDCHFVTLPMCPLNVRVPLLVPAQTVALAETVPPADAWLMVIVATEEFSIVQTPL